MCVIHDECDMCDVRDITVMCVSVCSALDLLFQNSQPKAKKCSSLVPVVKIPAIRMIM